VVAVYQKLMYLDDVILFPDTDEWQDFFYTFLPKMEEAIQEGDSGHKTLYCVFAAVVHQHQAERLAAPPSRLRQHYSNLAHVPKKFADLKGHPLAKECLEAMYTEIGKLIFKGICRKIPRVTGT
jgi:hypothetical protein